MRTNPEAVGGRAETARAMLRLSTVLLVRKGLSFQVATATALTGAIVVGAGAFLFAVNLRQKQGRYALALPCWGASSATVL